MLTQLILIVEPDPVVRMGLAIALRQLGNIDVMIAGSIRNSRKLIEHRKPDLTLAELHLRDGVSLELLTYLHHEGSLPRVIFMSSAITKYQEQIPKAVGITTMQKPVSPDTLQRLVRENLGLPTLLRDQQPFTLDEYLQIATIGKHSVLLELQNEQGKSASCAIWRGELYAALDSSGVGDEAFARICFSSIRDQPRLTCTTLAIPPLSRNILNTNWQGIFFAAATSLDEGRTRHGAFSIVPSPIQDLQGTIHLQPKSILFDTHLERGIDRVLRADYPEAVVCFRAALRIRPDDVRVQINLKRLGDLGFS